MLTPHALSWEYLVVLLPMYCCHSRRDATTLTDMGEQDWLEQGHGSGAGLQPMIKGSIRRTGERASIRSVLRGRDSAPRRSHRRTKAMVGWLLYCCTAVGGSAAAWTVRETLFPSLGAPTTRSVWENPRVDTTVTTEPASPSTESSVVLALAADAIVATTQSSVEPQTVPSASPPTNSVDNSGSGKAPTTGTTLADDPSSGPGPGTTVDDHSTDTSTPQSSSPGSVDTSTPDPSTSDSSGDSSGKGQGGSGAGGGGPPSP